MGELVFMGEECNQVHEVVDITTGEISTIVQSDVTDLSIVIVRDSKGIQRKVPVLDLICRKCRGGILPGDGLSLFFCPGSLQREYRG